jgi:acyl carrier protein
MTSITDQVCKIIGEELQMLGAALPSDSFEELDADSLDAVTIAMRLEEEFGIDIHDEAIEQADTVAKVIAFVEAHVAAKAASHG